MGRGIEQIRNIPADFELTTNQVVEVNAHKSLSPQIEMDQIKEFLAKLRYPLYFLDYESVSFAIPKYEGNWPHKHLTTQYSLHVLEDPNSSLKHLAYIHDDESNPSAAIANQLLKDIKDDGGSIVVYHQTFEKERTKELAGELPDLRAPLEGLIHRMWDLEIPFAKRWFWDHRFDGSSSIKNVLPAFKPDFSYGDLEVRKGDQAQLEYSKMIKLPKGHPDREKTKAALLKYCERDSIAMVLILKELLSLVQPKGSKKAV